MHDHTCTSEHSCKRISHVGRSNRGYVDNIWYTFLDPSPKSKVPKENQSSR